jgi:hypothetical protein
VLDKILCSQVSKGRIEDAPVLTDEELFFLAVCAGAMIRRVPFDRRQAEGMIPEMLRKTTDELKDRLRAAASEGLLAPEALERQLREIDTVEEKNAEEPPRDHGVSGRPLPSLLIAATISMMSWRILISKGFSTSSQATIWSSSSEAPDTGLEIPDRNLRFPSRRPTPSMGRTMSRPRGSGRSSASRSIG